MCSLIRLKELIKTHENGLNGAQRNSGVLANFIESDSGI